MSDKDKKDELAPGGALTPEAKAAEERKAKEAADKKAADLKAKEEAKAKKEAAKKAKEEADALVPDAPLYDGVDGNDPSVTQKTRQALKDQEHVHIMIPSTEQDDGKDDVPVGINGHVFLIKRDEKVRVPIAVLEVLDNAVIEDYRQVAREGGEGNVLQKFFVKRFPYMRV